MSDFLRTAIIAAVSSLLTLSLVAGCEVVRPLTGLNPVPAAPSPSASPAPLAAPPAAAPTLGAPASPVAQAQSAPSNQPNEPVIRVYRDYGPAVVNIISMVVARDFVNQAVPQPTGSGSGFIIDEDGNIITNNHVVQDADRLEVSLPDGTSVPAKLVGRDARSDLAVVRVDVPKEKLKVARLGDSSQVEIGELAIAIGNPFGYERTVTAGIVSARRPVVEEPNQPTAQGGSPGLLINAIQTDASINPGNSGGPLFNARGEVIGINTLIFAGAGPNGQGGNIGIGFAIPIDVAKRIIPELIKNGKYAHPWLGVTTQEITDTIANQVSLPVKQGLLVVQVDQGSPASRVGLRPATRRQEARSRQANVGGDIFTAVDGQPLKRQEDLVVYLEMQKRVGDTVTLTVLRDGQTLQVPIQLGERPTR